MYFKNSVFLLYLFSVLIGSRPIDAAVLDWFWSSSQALDKDGELKDKGVAVNVPYEIKTEAEKFLEEELKFTDIISEIKLKLDQTNKDIALQSIERSGQHQQVIADIEKIQSQAAAIIEGIEQSTKKLMAHHVIAIKQYEDTMRNLKKINETVGILSDLFMTTYTKLEERIDWIKSFLGDSGEELDKVRSAVLHIAYLLMGMLVSSFLQLPYVSRAALTFLLPLNLWLVYDRKADALDFSHITVILFSVTFVNVLVNFVLKKPVESDNTLRAKMFLKKSISVCSNLSTEDVNKMEQHRIVPDITETPPSSVIDEKHDQDQDLKVDKGNEPTPTTVPDKPTITSQSQKIASLSMEQKIPDEIPNKNGFSFNSSTGREPQYFNVTAISDSMIARRNEPMNNMVYRWFEDSQFREPESRPISLVSVKRRSTRPQCLATCKTGLQCRNPQAIGQVLCMLHLKRS